MAHAHKHYNTLGVRQGASVALIHQAHHQWVSNLHPWAEQDADERWARQQILDRVNAAVGAVLRARSHGAASTLHAAPARRRRTTKRRRVH